MVSARGLVKTLLRAQCPVRMMERSQFGCDRFVEPHKVAKNRRCLICGFHSLRLQVDVHNAASNVTSFGATI